MQNKTEEKKSSGSTVLADDGFYFGIGAFETIAVEEGIPQLLAWHLERLRDSLAFFGIDQSVEEQEVLAYLSACPQSEEKQHGALKITVTAQNKLFGLRKNTYSEAQYQKGFRLGFSEIMEKRNAKKCGLDEKIFLNQKGQISEGCTTNIFFIQDDKLVTPPVSSGMLPGVMRRYVIKEAGRRGVLLEEKELYPEDISKFNGCFVTNSLLGMMPAASFGELKFDTAKVLHFIEQIL